MAGSTRVAFDWTSDVHGDELAVRAWTTDRAATLAVDAGWAARFMEWDARDPTDVLKVGLPRLEAGGVSGVLPPFDLLLPAAWAEFARWERDLALGLVVVGTPLGDAALVVRRGDDGIGVVLGQEPDDVATVRIGASDLARLRTGASSLEMLVGSGRVDVGCDAADVPDVCAVFDDPVWSASWGIPGPLAEATLLVNGLSGDLRWIVTLARFVDLSI